MTTYYVSPTGSDAGPGTALLPWLTPQFANTILVAGDTLLFYDGTYNQDSTATKFLYTTKNGAVSQHITYKAINQWGARITSSGLGNPSIAIYNEGAYCDFIGLDISSLGRLGIEMAASHCTVQRCYIHDIPALPGSGGGAAVYLAQGFTDNFVLGCVIDHIGYDVNNQVQGVYMSSDHGGVWNCRVSRVAGWGIHLWHNSTNCSVFNNLSYNNGNGGLLVGADGGITNQGTIIANNIAYNNIGYGLRESGTTATNGGIKPIGVNTYTNNCFFGNTLGNTLFNSTTDGPNPANTAVNSVLATPQFTNYLPDWTGNYHLLSTSPCIHAGISAGAPTTDIDGTGRAQIGGYDIGPYQSQAVALFPTALRRGRGNYAYGVMRTSPPQAYYRLGEASGTTAFDSTTHGYNGTLHGGITLNQAGAFSTDSDTAMLFNGTSGYISLPSAFKTDGYTALSVEAWIKLSNNTFPSFPTVVANKLTNGIAGFDLIVSPSTAGTSGFWEIGNGTTDAALGFGTAVLSTGVWYHLVGTYDGTNMYAYLNGIQVATRTASGTLGTAPSVLNIGCDSSLARFFPGTIDEVAIYNYALTYSEVIRHYEIGIYGDFSTTLFPTAKRRQS